MRACVRSPFRLRRKMLQLDDPCSASIEMAGTSSGRMTPYLAMPYLAMPYLAVTV